MTNFPTGGYHLKILRVDLTRAEISQEPLLPEMLHQYIGGAGLAVRLLYDETVPQTDSYAPANPLIFATGPLTGTTVPGTGTYTVVTKSALTGLATVAQANGFFGARLKYAGYDAVIIQGCSSKPVYLHITDLKAEILDGSFVQGKDTFETDRILRKRHGENGYESRLSVAAIGPAGENRVRFACICSDRGHIVATGGVGAVMGSKNLKAIVVHGSQKIPLDTGQAERLMQLTGQWRAEAHKTSLGQTIHHKGTLGLFGPYHSRGWVPVKNLTTNIIDDPEVFDGDRIRSELYRMIPRSCHGCTFAHCHTVEIKKGKYKGFVGEEPEYEIMAGFGSNWGINDPAAVTMLNGLNDRLGLDGKETSFLLSMIMEGYDRGFIDREALDGIDLRWGNVAAVETMLKKISSREGIGNILAEGVMRAAEKLGNEFVDMAVFVKKGNAPHIHDPRTRWGTLFTQVISNMGSQEGMDMTVRANPELGFDKPTSDPDPYLALVQSKTGPKRQFEECLVFCYFQSCTFETMIETLNTITGAGYDRQDCLKIGRRIINLLRMFNIREGFTKEADSFSPRLGQSPVDGPGKGKSITATFESVRDAYYQAMQWDADGIPTPETLAELNLDFTLAVLGNGR